MNKYKKKVQIKPDYFNPCYQNELWLSQFFMSSQILERLKRKSSKLKSGADKFAEKSWLWPMAIGIYQKVSIIGA